MIAPSICSSECSWLLRRLRACFQSKIPFLIRKCAHCSRIRAHQSKSETFNTCLSRRKTKPASVKYCVWFWRWIRLVIHFRDKFLYFLYCGTSCFKNDFSLQCQKEPVSHFNQYSRIYSSILAGQRPISLPPVIVAAISSTVFFDETFSCYCTAG